MHGAVLNSAEELPVFRRTTAVGADIIDVVAHRDVRHVRGLN